MINLDCHAVFIGMCQRPPPFSDIWSYTSVTVLSVHSRSADLAVFGNFLLLGKLSAMADLRMAVRKEDSLEVFERS